MGWMWELDSLRPLFHGLDMGVGQFGVFIPWVECGVMVRPPFPFSTHLLPPPSPSTSAPPLLPPLHSNSKACLRNLRNCITPTLRLTMDQHQTHSDLVPMPRATICIPFLHLSYLPDPFSLTIMDNYSFLV